MSEISRRLDRLPFCRFHRRLLLIGGLGYTFDGMDLTAMAFMLPVLSRQWHLSGALTGLLASSTYVGYLFGALVAGSAGDLIGRKKVMMNALFIYTIASLLCTLANQWSTFYVLRVLAGFGFGAESAIIAPYLAEFVGQRYRGRFVGALVGFLSFGALLAAALSYFIIGQDRGGYKVLLVVTALPILMLLWWRRALPESPRWLEGQNRVEQAKAIVAQLEAAASEDGHELEPVPAEASTLQGRAATLLGNLAALWAGQLVRITTVCWFIWISLAFSYYAFFTWMPTLLVQRGMPIARSFGFSVAIYAAQIPGYFSAAYLNERVGRRAVIAGYMSLAAVSAGALSLARTDAQLVVSGMCLSCFMNGTFGTLYVYTAEIFPTRVRATGMGTSSSIGRLGAIGAPIVVGLVYPSVGFAGVFGITTTVLLIGAAVIAILGLSTRGRSLEEITKLTGSEER